MKTLRFDGAAALVPLFPVVIRNVSIVSVRKPDAYLNTGLVAAAELSGSKRRRARTTEVSFVGDYIFPLARVQCAYWTGSL